MNRGAKATLAALKDRGLSINKGAELVGSDEGNFSKILREESGRKPGRKLSLRIFNLLGISPALWDERVPGDNEPSDADQLANASNPARSV